MRKDIAKQLVSERAIRTHKHLLTTYRASYTLRAKREEEAVTRYVREKERRERERDSHATGFAKKAARTTDGEFAKSSLSGRSARLDSTRQQTSSRESDAFDRAGEHKKRRRRRSIWQMQVVICSNRRMKSRASGRLKIFRTYSNSSL